MKHHHAPIILTAFGTALLSTTTALAAPTLVQSNAREITVEKRANPVTLNDTKAGNTIIVFHVLDNVDGVTTTDSQGNSYKTCGVAQQWHGGQWYSRIDYATNIKDGANTVKANYLSNVRKGGERFGRIYVQEFSGIDPVNACAAAASANGNGTAANSGSVSVGGANQLIIGGVGAEGSVISPRAGYATASNAFGGLVQYRLTTAAGPEAVTATTTSGDWTAHAALFNAAGGVVDPTPVGNIKANSCSSADVQAAINKASDGYIVTVPAGTCTWNNAVSINNKAITLIGAGAGDGGTKIVHNGGEHTLLSIAGGSITGKVDVSGFLFYGGSKKYWGGNAIEFSGKAGWGNLRIHHNTFEDNQLWTMRGSASTNGLIDNNTFLGEGYGLYFTGQGALDWKTPINFGSKDFFFIEDNKFHFDDWYGVTGVPASDMNEGGRTVFRNNSLRHSFWETHDKARSGLVSANAYEIYNNTFYAETLGYDKVWKWKTLDVSAGTGVIWGNTIQGSWNTPIGAVDYKTADPRYVEPCDGKDPADKNVAGQTGWICQYQIGSENEGPAAVSSPLYVWSNTYNAKPVGMKCTGGCEHLVDGRDFINGQQKPGYTPYPYPHPLTR